jgi:hypothetical protein
MKYAAGGVCGLPSCKDCDSSSRRAESDELSRVMVVVDATVLAAAKIEDGKGASGEDKELSGWIADEDDVGICPKSVSAEVLSAIASSNVRALSVSVPLPSWFMPRRRRDAILSELSESRTDESQSGILSTIIAFPSLCTANISPLMFLCCCPLRLDWLFCGCCREKMDLNAFAGPMKSTRCRSKGFGLGSASRSSFSSRTIRERDCLCVFSPSPALASAPAETFSEFTRESSSENIDCSIDCC